MQFQVPQFIKRELKIVGPMTFRQFLYVGGGLLCCFGLYLFLAQKSVILFLISSLMVVSAGLALAFLKIKGRPLTTVIANFFLFSFSQRTYLWKRKVFTPKLIQVERKEPKKIQTRPGPKITEKSKLQNLSSKLEMGIK